MINEREKAFQNISKVLAISRYDIEQRQSVNDLGLNIHGENYFRDVFNFVYDYEFENENFNSQNSSCIDLLDKKNKIAYQITTTRTTEKLVKTFKALKDKKYNGYVIKVLYLLEKAKPNKNTQEDFKKNHGIDLKSHLLDYTDLINKINDLETNKLIELNNKYFKNLSEKYTNEIVLNLVFKHLILNANKIQKNYDDDFGNIDTQNKILLNNINPRISNKINSSLDYISLIRENDESNLLDDLRTLIIEKFYKKILIEILSSKISLSELNNISVNELQDLSVQNNLNFNKIINNLHIELETKIDISDYNSMSITWIIISFFFEICDIGIKK
ncbi:SMEK domain-containing protein [Tenacibaculum piscium]|uniref:SMEK domain-containing protein n=1 Tax=Tenacibaculum piscium TaxID=1458515 RepID=UPI001F492B0D|nr:SMEK domain-containing protein [Tenacibaculum piscium]